MWRTEGRESGLDDVAGAVAKRSFRRASHVAVVRADGALERFVQPSPGSAEATRRVSAAGGLVRGCLLDAAACGLVRGRLLDADADEALLAVVNLALMLCTLAHTSHVKFSHLYIRENLTLGFCKKEIY